MYSYVTHNHIQIDTKEQAEAAVRHSKYPPLGTRGFPPSNLIHGVTDGVIPRRKNIRDSNDQNSAVFFMIESKEGVENVEDIVAVAGSESPLLATLARPVH